MTVFKRPGSPYYQYDFIFLGSRYRGSTKLTNKVAAQRVEDIRKAELAQARGGLVPHHPSPLFREYTPQFLDTVKLERRPNTHRCYSICIENLKPWFGAKRLSEISADQIRQFKEARLKEGRKGSTVNRDLACLRRILSCALKTDLITTSPFVTRKVEFLPENGRERVLSFSEERRYLAAARPVLKEVAVLILETGMRPEEVFRLRREEVHLHALPPYVHVQEGKTKNARRDVPLTEHALDVLKRRVFKGKGEFLFPLRVGNGHDWSSPMSELQPAHKEALKESGIRPPFRIYDLRHTYGTRAIEAGTDPLTLAKLMGHADLKTTMRYVHLSKRHLTEAQTRIERFRAEREIAEATANYSAVPQ